MFNANVKRTVYGFELYNGGSRLATCDDLGKVENLIIWLSALDSLHPLEQVLASRKTQPIPQIPTMPHIHVQSLEEDSSET